MIPGKKETRKGTVVMCFCGFNASERKEKNDQTSFCNSLRRRLITAWRSPYEGFFTRRHKMCSMQ